MKSDRETEFEELRKAIEELKWALLQPFVTSLRKVVVWINDRLK